VSGGDEQISVELSVDEVIERWPATARVFIARRMHCVGCEVARFETVADACRIYGRSPDAMLVELRAAVCAAPETEHG
jgi:hybrid cluster-associated redox disulfide protein